MHQHFGGRNSHPQHQHQQETTEEEDGEASYLTTGTPNVAKPSARLLLLGRAYGSRMVGVLNATPCIVPAATDGGAQTLLH